MRMRKPDEELVADGRRLGLTNGPVGETLRALAARVEALRAELADLKIRTDVDALGGHEKDAIALVEAKAEVERLRGLCMKIRQTDNAAEARVIATRAFPGLVTVAGVGEGT